MDLERVKKFFALFLTAFGFLVLIFIIYSIFIISRYAQEKRKHEIEKGYAGEQVTISPSPPIRLK